MAGMPLSIGRVAATTRPPKASPRPKPALVSVEKTPFNSTPADRSLSLRPGDMIDPALAKFQRLSTQWKRETGHLSNFTKKVTHIAYLKIVGMGWSVVPLLLEELRREPGHWFSALHLITEADPVREEDAGDIEAICSAWVRWGEEHGYLVRRSEPPRALP